MITGYNTDVEFDGRIFHVQTEDKGRANPMVESLVYSGGEILTTRRLPYEDLAASEEYSEEAVMKLMEGQHQDLIREIQNGKFDPEGPKPFGYNIITNRSLDEVVLEFLHSRVREEPISLELIDEQVIQEGTRPTVRMKVVERETRIPVAAAEVAIRLISTNGEPRELFSASSDEEGFLEASFEVPSLPGADTALIVSAEAGGQRAEVRQFVVKGRPESAT